MGALPDDVLTKMVDAGDERLPKGYKAERHGRSKMLLSDEDLLVEDARCHGSSLAR
ncbi:hypothetical protein ACLOJK_034924 [Asimina triloba]